jgi:8-oxo-dGTP pyrophosphatase MutT (NUDIX family)
VDPELIRRSLHEALARPPQRLEFEKSASVAILIGGAAMLWIRRAENPQDPWSGHMGFPGGRSEPSDPDSRHTAERETLEELGISLSDCAQYIGALDEVQARNRFGLQPFKIAPHVYWSAADAPCRPDPVEVDEVHWIPLEHFFDQRHATTHELAHNGQTHLLPAYRFGRRIIWGLSHRILNDFLTRLKETPLGKLLSR